MNYLKDEIKNALSSQYVVGTLSAKARLRYKRLMMQENELQQNVWHWENHLNQLAETLKPQQPGEKVWRNIELKLGFVNVDQPEIKNVWYRNWGASFALMSLMFVALLLYVLQIDKAPMQLPDTSQVAVVQNAQSQALWSIEIQKNVLKVQATPALTAYRDKDYQLWMIAEGELAPIPLGLLPQTGAINLAKINGFDDKNIQALAVSLEPLGGSPNGSPTEVLYTTQLVTL